MNPTVVDPIAALGERWCFGASPALMSGRGVQRRVVEPWVLVWAAAFVCGVSDQDVYGPGRAREVVRARGLAALSLRVFLAYSWPDVGKALGRTGHTTAMTRAKRYADRTDAGEMLGRVARMAAIKGGGGRGDDVMARMREVMASGGKA